MLDIVDDQRLLFTVTGSKIHGKIDVDETFGGCCWSPDETQLVYVAEPAPKTSASFWDSSDVKAAATPPVDGAAADACADAKAAEQGSAAAAAMPAGTQYDLQCS